MCVRTSKLATLTYERTYVGVRRLIHSNIKLKQVNLVGFLSAQLSSRLTVLGNKCVFVETLDAKDVQ